MKLVCSIIHGHVRYYTREEAENSMRYINGTRLDNRIIRTDWDAGFVEGRQYGRGKTGGQVNFLNCRDMQHYLHGISQVTFCSRFKP